MGDSMSTIINATTTNGVVIQPDNSGSLVLQTNSGTTAVTVDTSQNTTFAGKVTSAGALTLASNGTTTALTIDASQNVGIGTTSPSIGIGFNTLKVKGVGAGGIGTAITESTDGASWLQLYSGASTSDDPTFIYPTGKVLRFGTGTQNTSSYTERMRIDSSGNVLVGTTTSIDVASGSTDGATIYPDSLQISRNGGTPLLMRRRSSNGEMVAFRRDTTFVGSISVTTTATAYNTSSDYRLKENIQPLQNALDVVAQLNPVNYTWKSDGSDGQGFIAHELQAVVPDCVTGEKDGVDAEGNPVYQGVDTSFLVATLTAAIQEMKAIIDAQSARIDALENK
jgi:hypothetical protein